MKKYFASALSWTFLARATNAGISFFTVPLLLTFFGADEYGILTLAIATNASLALLDIGINTGTVRFYSQWLSAGASEKVEAVARASVFLYCVIGAINAVVLIGISFFGAPLFHLTPAEFSVLKSLLLINAGFSIANWVGLVFHQLLVASEMVSVVQKVSILQSAGALGLVGVTYYAGLSLRQYFFGSMVLAFASVIFLFLVVSRLGLVKSIRPKADFKAFSPVLRYSLSIFAMGFFQFIATSSRPIVLGIFNNTGPQILADFRVVEVFPAFLVSLGGSLLTILLPVSSRIIQEGDVRKIELLAYRGTALAAIAVALLAFPVFINAEDLLRIFVGENYVHLTFWLQLWVISIVLYLYNSPISSLVLATGRTRALVYSSAIACVTSIILNSILAPRIGMGSAVIGYFVYVVMQVSVYYLYFNNRVLHLNSWRVFAAFLKPVSLAVAAAAALILLPDITDHVVAVIVIRSCVWMGVFIAGLLIFKVVAIRDIRI